MRLCYLLTIYILLFFSILGQAEEGEYQFPDNHSLQINQNIDTYQDNDYSLTKSFTLELLQHAKQCEEEELILLSYTALEYYSYLFNEKKDFAAITIEADSVFKSIISSKKLSIYADYYFEHLNNYSIHLFRKNEIAAADSLITNAIHLLENNTFNSNTKNYYLSAFYANLSSFKELQWNFNDGLMLLKKANGLEDKSDFSLGYINENLSRYHQKTGNYYEALDFAQIALENYKNSYLNDSQKVYLKHYLFSSLGLAKIYILLEDSVKAQEYLNLLLSFSLDNEPLINVKFLQVSAERDLLEENPISALKNYQKCLRLQQEKLPNRIIEKVEIQKSIAQLLQEQNQLDSSFHYLQLAVIELTNNPKLKDVYANPKSFDNVVYKQSLLDILQYKSEFLLEKYAQSQDICDLISAKQTSVSAQNLADKIRLELSSNFDKELFSKKGHKVYVQAMKIVALLEEFEHTDENVAFAYRAMESSRALILAEAVYQSNTKEFAGIPSRFILREEKFREQIVEKERQIFQLEQEGEEAKDYRNEKYLLQGNFANFTDSLQFLYPDYYNLKFAVQRPPIAALQSDLKKDNQTLIEYFIGDENIYALITDADRHELKTWVRPAQLLDKIKALRAAIYDEGDYTTSPTIFVDNAHSLYQDLVAPLGDLPKRLVIVPDGILNYLPFDVLLTELPQYATNYQSHSYLLNDKQISYEYSATLRMQKRKKTSKRNNFVGFAPYYKQHSTLATRGIGDLKYNIAEVDSIKFLFGGISFVGDEAVKQNFRNQCGHASIVHFAGHAVQEEINPDFSHLLFSKNTPNNNKNQMPVREIYARHINAEMVVLSACNTGMGEIQRGEGMYSLGRAFSYAGAQSLVSTLWSVNDESTKDIMISFYKNLKDDMTKDEALWKAKKDFISKHQTNIDSRPLFWAGFVAYGDMQALDLHSKPWWKFW